MAEENEGQGPDTLKIFIVACFGLAALIGFGILITHADWEYLAQSDPPKAAVKAATPKPTRTPWPTKTPTPTITPTPNQTTVALIAAGYPVQTIAESHMLKSVPINPEGTQQISKIKIPSGERYTAVSVVAGWNTTYAQLCRQDIGCIGWVDTQYLVATDSSKPLPKVASIQQQRAAEAEAERKWKDFWALVQLAIVGGGFLGITTLCVLKKTRRVTLTIVVPLLYAGLSWIVIGLLASNLRARAITAGALWLLLIALTQLVRVQRRRHNMAQKHSRDIAKANAVERKIEQDTETWIQQLYRSWREQRKALGLTVEEKPLPDVPPGGGREVRPGVYIWRKKNE